MGFRGQPRSPRISRFHFKAPRTILGFVGGKGFCLGCQGLDADYEGPRAGHCFLRFAVKELQLSYLNMGIVPLK